MSGDDPLLEQQRAHFNSIADAYREARSGRNHLLLKELIWRDALARHRIAVDRPLDVLEPMCGFAEGRGILSRFVQPDIRYTGYDFSDRVVELLRQSEPGIDVFHADATTYSPPEASFDVAILLGGLHHVHARARQTIERIVPSLRPGGWFINLEPTHGNPVTAAVREAIYRRNAIFDAETERSFGVSELCGMFERAGLVREELLFPGLLSYVLYYNPDAFPALNRGGPGAVRAAFSIDRPFIRGPVGRVLSFAMLSIWRRPG